VACLEPGGTVAVYSSQSQTGQGHETSLAQVAADELGIPVADVRLVYGDTRTAPFNTQGTGGSTAATMATGAVMYAARGLKEKVLTFAGLLLEVAAEELEIAHGEVAPRGAPGRGMTFRELAERSCTSPPAGEEPGLRASSAYKSGPGGWSGGTHACLLEIDRETGLVEILRYVVSEDCGMMINPALVEGQVRGGVAMGIGVALFEEYVRDELGNVLTSTLMDYLVPLATDIPRIEIVHVEPEPLHEVDFRGVGEGGMIVAPAVIANAIADAIGGLDSVDLPLTPSRLLELMDARGL
jgi:carbon-monoxide dehydrogenase large subunit